MISVIVGTDRQNSRTAIIAKHIKNRLNKLTDEDIQLLDLAKVDQPYLIDNKYNSESQTQEIKEVQDQYFISADKWIVIAPEYNGGIPGVLKYLIDSISIREYQNTFLNKRIALVGTSAGKAGNLRGLDYLANLFSYVKAIVFRNRLPLSQIESLINADELVDQVAIDAIDLQLKEFIAVK